MTTQDIWVGVSVLVEVIRSILGVLSCYFTLKAFNNERKGKADIEEYKTALSIYVYYGFCFVVLDLFGI